MSAIRMDSEAKTLPKPFYVRFGTLQVYLANTFKIFTLLVYEFQFLEF